MKWLDRVFADQEDREYLLPRGLSIPTVAPFGEPVICGINDAWMTYVLSAVAVLANRGVWRGDQAEQDAAIANVDAILNAIATGAICENASNTGYGMTLLDTITPGTVATFDIDFTSYDDYHIYELRGSVFSQYVASDIFYVQINNDSANSSYSLYNSSTGTSNITRNSNTIVVSMRIPSPVANNLSHHSMTTRIINQNGFFITYSTTDVSHRLEGASANSHGFSNGTYKQNEPLSVMTFTLGSGLNFHPATRLLVFGVGEKKA